MRVASRNGRLSLVIDGRIVDVERSSGGRYSSDPQRVWDDWDGFMAWASGADHGAGEAFDLTELDAPVPRPRQVFAIGINYAEHAAEAGYPPDSLPVTFTKFPSSLTGPVAHVQLSSATVDWEVELVVVIGAQCDFVKRDAAWTHVAGAMVGQDLSDRTVQAVGAKPQYSLAKSFRGYSPTGPWVTTTDELSSRDDLAIQCSLSGEVMQSSRTSSLIYDIPELIERLSAICTLFPGDLIFTGTPAGVGNARSPKRFIGSDDVLVSTIEGLGELTTTFLAPVVD
ncbi:MAG: fumarylacetoacetate hydrolase family protein [Acidobacteria bacterium]|nr:fumarylacetoacetate hydrolase family protein [Acidobacteriota bacterium]